MNRRAKATAAKADKKKQNIEFGSISTLSPKIATIIISMKYARTGALEPLLRVVNFTPDSAALFKVSCLCTDCPEGNFDFTQIIQSMLKGHKTISKGAISCENCSSPECTGVAYTTTIKYR